MCPLTGVLVCKDVRKMLTNCKNVSFFELSKAIANIIGAFPFENTADLNLFVLMKLGEEIIRPVFLEQKSRVFRFGYAEREYFHELKIAKYYLNYQYYPRKKVI